MRAASPVERASTLVMKLEPPADLDADWQLPGAAHSAFQGFEISESICHRTSSDYL